MNSELNSLKADIQIDDETQVKLNNPTDNPGGHSDETTEFITAVMKRVYSNEIDVFNSQTLINTQVYDTASELAQGKADMLAISLCSKLRELKNLMEISGGEQLFIKPTYQASHLVEDIKYRKEQFESEYGNLFVI
jgi:hypothetical protein